MPNSRPDNTQELERLLDSISYDEYTHQHQVAGYEPRQAAKARREWDKMRGQHLNQIQTLITQSNLKAVEAFAANLLKWTDNNKHDLGEIGQFIRVRYVKTGIDQELAKLKENKD